MADEPVRFRLLGPVDVCLGGTTLQLRGSQPRCVLAVLLLDAGQVTSVDRLVDALWGDRLPRDPRGLLQVHVSRLRRLLAGVPGVDLQTVGRHGYRLDVPAEWVDLFRFRALVERAQACDDPGERVGLLDQALALWHGDPLGGAAGDYLAQRVAPALSEERQLAREARVTALLRSGRHEDVVPELSLLLAERPMRENLAAALMRALHGTGRTDEALAVFRDLRARMVDELGVEPSEPIQELHRALLGGGEVAAPGDAAPVVVPAQLPSDVSGFVGREASVARLVAAVERSGTTPRVLTVAGPPGAGKTALAVHVGHLARGRFADGQLYANLAGARDPVDPGDVLGAFLAALGVPAGRVPTDVAERAALFRSVLAGRRVLVVLDDARDAAQVRPLLPGVPGSAVLVTSRSALASLDADVRVDLGPLDHDDAVRLLAAELDEARLATDPAALDEMVRACGHLALAVRIVGRRLATRPRWSVRAVADRLADERDRLAELSVDDLSVDASIRLSYRQLDARPARAFRLLGLAEGGDVGLVEAAALLGEPRRHTARLLDGLCEAHLVDPHGDDRFRLHDMLRVFARGEAGAVDSAETRDAAVTRLACAYAQGLRDASLVRSPGLLLDDFGLPVTVESQAFDDAEAATAWLQAEHANIVAAVRCACRRGTLPAGAVSRIAGAFARFADPRGLLTELAVLTDVAVARARAEGDRYAEGMALIGLGGLRMRRHGALAGLPVVREAAALLHGSGTRPEATALNNVAVFTDDPAERLDCVRRALAVYESLGDERGAVTALGNIADHYLRTGEFGDAVEIGRRSVARAQDVGAPDLVASTQVTLAEALHGAGEHSEAIRLIRDTLRRAEDVGSGVITSLASLAHARMLRDTGSLDDAVDWYERTLAAFRELGAQHDVATTTEELADVLRRAGRPGRARQLVRDVPRAS